MNRSILLPLALSIALPLAGFAAEDVKSLGLKADGVTDDTAALQAALSAGHTDLSFPNSEYFIGSIAIPADSRLVFAPGTKIKVNVAKATVSEEVDFKGKKRTVKHVKPLFQVQGDRVRIEGLQFDFASGGTENSPTPLEQLISAEGVSDLVVSNVGVSNSAGKMVKDSLILMTTTKCRHVVLEESHATQISHMLMAKDCADVTVRGNWMIGGADMTTFSGGSECLRHHDNWSRQVGYQCVWRGGSPDPSRKAPRVPLGTANVAQRGVHPGDPGWIDHTEGAFDVIIKNNYAEYGTTLCWGNKGRQTIIEGNISRFMFDYAFGTEGGENLVFANNISINSAVAGICSLYWGEKMSITGNLIIVRHEPFDQTLTNKPESTYYGQFIRLHHGPANPEDKYGVGGVQISGNTFINELADRTSGISIEAGRDVLVNGNKIINGLVRKHEELFRVKDAAAEAKDAKEGDEFQSQNPTQPGQPNASTPPTKEAPPAANPAPKLERRVGTDQSRVTITGNEFITRQGSEKACVIIDGTVSSAIVKDNVFRREASILPVNDAQRELEKGPPRYMLYAKDGAPVDLTNADPKTAILLSPVVAGLSIVQGNLIYGWTDAIRAENGSPDAKMAFVITGNSADGKISADGAKERTTIKLDGNITLPPGIMPDDIKPLLPTASK